MAQIEITKQPLYGTVYWDGYDFIYTPKQGFTGNDVFYYTKTENGVVTSYRKYVNPTNAAPIATDLSLSADARYRTVISINDLMVDDTNPFNELKIVSIESPLIGKIENTGTELYYYPNNVNTIEHLDYVISDKQFFSTGTLTLSVINASKQLPLENDTFKYRLPKNYTIATRLTGLSSNWESTTDVLTTYKDTWNAFDPTNNIAFSNYIEPASGNLNKLYNNMSAYSAAYVLVSTNSGTWINDRNIIDYIKNNKLNLSATYDIVSLKSNIWNNDYTNLSVLSTAFDSNTIKFDSLTATVNTNLNKWDSNEIYNVFEPNYYKWNTTYSVLCTAKKNNEWNNAISAANILLSQESVSAADNFNNIYNTITANSGL